MRSDAGALLHAEGRFAVGRERVPLARLATLTVCAGAVYGAVMGSYGGDVRGVVFAALKVPLLLVASLSVCVPVFYVTNALLGLRADFGAALRAIASAQGTFALALASLSPVTACFHVCGLTYGAALFWNGCAFLLALGCAQTLLARHYRPLVARDRRHALARAVWFALQVFVGIKAGWVLRPFVGDPALPVEFLRAGRWYENPYTNVFWNIVGVGWNAWRALGGG